MQIDNLFLQKLEKLSSLKVDQRDKTIKELNGILSFIDNLSELNFDNKNFTHSDLSTPYREDVSFDHEIVDEILKNAPSTCGRFFTVPKIIE